LELEERALSDLHVSNRAGVQGGVGAEAIQHFIGSLRGDLIQPEDLTCQVI
jgi:hypothetical protein